MAYRKSTLRKLPGTTRKLARLIGELDSISRRAKNLLADIENLEHDSRALAHAKPLFDYNAIQIKAKES